MIVIVGGGPAGLSTAGALKKVGLDSVVLDRDERVGGSWLRRYDRLRLHSVRRFSGLAHFPIPATYPKYIPKDLYAQYLQEYVRHLDLDIELNCTVHRIRVDDERHTNRQTYVVETDRGPRYCQSVVIATGMYGKAALPTVPGLNQYQGFAIHSSGYVSGRDFARRRVLVVGLGNTGGEIAADLVEQGASFVAVSVRTTPPVVPRDFLGTPVQVFGIALSGVPVGFADRVGRTIARVAIGDLSRYGLRRPDWQPFSAQRIPVIDVGFARNLKRGHISIRPGVVRFFESGAAYDDGREEAFDAIVFATGYTTGLKQILDVPGLLDEDAFPRLGLGQRTSQPGLYFMGFVKSHRGHLFEMNRASRRFARDMRDERA
jgi:cation diffusion facilitator CzcD-associated flavoprotein CzcO